MFKPFSAHDEQQERARQDETGVMSGDAWRRWNMDDLSSKRPVHAQHANSDSADTSAEFIHNAELAALKEQARKEAWEQAYQEGLKAGHDEGFTKGYQDAQDAVAQEKEALIAETLTPVTALAKEFSDALNQMDTLIGESLVELALAVGTQLARTQLDMQPEQILNIARELLQSDPAFTDKPRLHVHPDDFALIHEHMREELQIAGWHLQADERMARGGCRLTSHKGERDASWETRSETVRKQLRTRHTAEDSE
ncbi:flagellar assembly protein FliH [Aliidiomarina halalkaliphila]|uniref:Flagellar assembly protein FliH n=1 Tax=Aliidiomarina halalkaliphila TaxID=2593535 RepID=A0A552X1A1_9GAMM|nr:flagellar assembly protein FliH [Aliidiomarina halalkaliphila]TRW48822.1 flagellar assembly protein FliH [Aliidiomarina halalkaliphila]